MFLIQFNYLQIGFPIFQHCQKWYFKHTNINTYMIFVLKKKNMQYFVLFQKNIIRAKKYNWLLIFEPYCDKYQMLTFDREEERPPNVTCLCADLTFIRPWVKDTDVSDMEIPLPLVYDVMGLKPWVSVVSV